MNPNFIVNVGMNQLTSNLPPPNISPFPSRNMSIDESTAQRANIPQHILNNHIPAGLPKTPSLYNQQKQIQNNNTLSIPRPPIPSHSLSPCFQQYNYMSPSPSISNNNSLHMNIPSPISLMSKSNTMRQLSNGITISQRNKSHSILSNRNYGETNNSSQQHKKRHNDNNNHRHSRDGDNEQKKQNDSGENEMEDDDSDINDDIETEHGGKTNVVPLCKLEQTSQANTSATQLCLNFQNHPLKLKNKWKSWPITSNKSLRRNSDPWLFVYDPGYVTRVQGCIIITKTLTEKIIPNTVVENVENVYDFMDKSTAIAVNNGKYYDNGYIRIFNYGFHNRDGEELYCVMEKINKATNRNYEYLMRDKLFTTKEILSAYGLTHLKYIDLPTVSCGINPILKRNMDKIYDILNDEKCFSEQVMCDQKTQDKRKWNKITVFSTMNKKQLAVFNKNRVTLSITPNSFVEDITAHMNDIDKVSLIPIIMFNCNGYRYEYIHIVRLRNNINIGISYVFDEKYGIKVAGLHLNKDNIIAQHQLVLNHDCHCLDNFQSNINFLHIGNPDDDKNRFQAVKKDNIRLKAHNKALISENASLKQNMCNIQNENEHLKQNINNLKKQKEEQQKNLNEYINYANTLSQLNLYYSRQFSNNSIPTMPSFPTTFTYRPPSTGLTNVPNLVNNANVPNNLCMLPNLVNNANENITCFPFNRNNI